MMRRRKRQEIQVFSLSFLDIVSCGFGAIILLLVISRFSEPRVVEQITQDFTAQVQVLQQKKEKIIRESHEMEQKIRFEQAKLSLLHKELAQSSARLRKIEDRFSDARNQERAETTIAALLESAKQELTREMERLYAMMPVRSREKSPVGGIPVDSEYIIFVIDTSGSMRRFAWPLVRKKMAEILSIYPRVKGIQIMNDMGDYMFSHYAGRWIPDSPARRRAILKRLASWAPFSNSSPVEGITHAIKTFYSRKHKISIYVLGDDFSKGSIQRVIDTVNRLNRAGGRGDRRVRIHAIGFPVLMQAAPGSENIVRFSALMRRLAEDNGGSFVGLSTLKP